jgi:hypothetical protein
MKDLTHSRNFKPTLTEHGQSGKASTRQSVNPAARRDYDGTTRSDDDRSNDDRGRSDNDRTCNAARPVNARGAIDYSVCFRRCDSDGATNQQ